MLAVHNPTPLGDRHDEFPAWRLIVALRRVGRGPDRIASSLNYAGFRPRGRAWHRHSVKRALRKVDRELAALAYLETQQGRASLAAYAETLDPHNAARCRAVADGRASFDEALVFARAFCGHGRGRKWGRA